MLVSEIESSLETSKFCEDKMLLSCIKFESSVSETSPTSLAQTVPNTMKNVSTIDIMNALFFIEIFPPLGSHYENFIAKYDYTKI